MAINKFAFDPINGLLDKDRFPTQPVSEEDARGQFMTLFNQIKDYLNVLNNPINLKEYTPELSSPLQFHSTFFNKFTKSQEGIVPISCGVSWNTDNNSISNGRVLLTLPVEIRPNRRVVAACLCSRLGLPNSSEFVNIDPNGNVSLQQINNTVDTYCIIFSVSYVVL